jgi:hypothetical protein
MLIVDPATQQKPDFSPSIRIGAKPTKEGTSTYRIQYIFFVCATYLSYGRLCFITPLSPCNTGGRAGPFARWILGAPL